jgi:adenylosuccinate synthase
VIDVVVGGQFGSESKGAVTAALVRRKIEQGVQPSAIEVIRVGGPNAGHTAFDQQGRAWALRQVPVGMVVHPEVRGTIAAGSEVDFDVLLDEVRRLQEAGHVITDRLYVDPSATVLEPKHREAEVASTLNARLGSTAKGIGQARMDRLNRTAEIVGSRLTSVGWCEGHPAITDRIVEGTQGYGLGLHSPFYPFATSGDCRAIDALAQAGLSPWAAGEELAVWLVVRPHPIRVAGNSGPLQDETTWAALGLPPEYTTVTKKERRVGGWDAALVAAAVEANGGSPVVRIALGMADQVVPGLMGSTHYPSEIPDAAALEHLVQQVESCGARVAYLGTGPNSCIWTEQ